MCYPGELILEHFLQTRVVIGEVNYLFAKCKNLLYPTRDQCIFSVVAFSLNISNQAGGTLHN